MTRKKKTQQNSNSTLLKTSKEIRECTVVLRDIALETDLIQRYQLHLPLKKENLSKQSASRVNTSLHSNIHTNKQLIKKNAVKNRRCTITKNLRKKGNYKKIKSQQSGKDTRINKNISLSHQYYKTPKFTLSKCTVSGQQLIHHSDATSFSSTFSSTNIDETSSTNIDETSSTNIDETSSTNIDETSSTNIDETSSANIDETSSANIDETSSANIDETSSTNIDETSSTSTDTHFTYMQKMAILMNNKNNKNVKKLSTKKIKELDSKKMLHLNKSDKTCDADINSVKVSSNDANCLDKKNLTVIDYNSNMQDISSKSIKNKRFNNNLHPFNISDAINSKVKQKLCRNNQNSKDNIIQTIYGGMSPKNETKTPIEKQNLPKIIENYVLPKGIKILKVRIEKLRINNSLQNNIPTQISLEQDVTTRCNNNDKNTDQTFYNNDTIETITTTEDKEKEKEHHTSLEINRSFNTLKISSPLNNNFDLKDRNLLNNKLHNKVINYRNLNYVTKARNNDNIDINDIDNEIITTHENCTLNYQEQLNRVNNNTKVHENNILQDNRKSEKRCTKTILNKNISDFMDIDNENCNISTSILASKEKTVKETLKRTLKEKDEDCNQDNKKMKLNRNSCLQNNVFKSSNYQQYNDSLSSTTTNTTVETYVSKEHNHEERSDLRKFLNQIKSEKSLKLKPTVEIANEGSAVCKKLSIKEESILNETIHEKKSDAQEKHTNIASDNEDDDCISLFAESFAEFYTSQCEDTSLKEKDKSCKSLHCDVPYTMTASSFDKYVKQNNKEFNKEYAKCIKNKNDTEFLKSDKANEISNNQYKQILNTDFVPATTIQSKSSQIKNIYSKKKTLYDFIRGYCFQVLKIGKCYKSQYQCIFKHEIKTLFYIINANDSKTILNIISEALTQNFNYFCEEVYIALLKKLTIDQILITYKMLHGNWNVNWRMDFTMLSRKNIACNIIKELLSRQMPLKTIVDNMMTHILPTNNLKELNNILLAVDIYVKSGEYWDITKNLILTLQSNISKRIIDRILYECIRSKKLQEIQDVNSNLISKLDSTLISTLDKHAMKCFKNILVEKTAKNSEVLTQNFGKSLTTDTIASPDSPDPKQSISFTQQESPTRCDAISINETDVNQNETCITQDVNVAKPYMYGFMQPIDTPSARSVYRDHERFWKFYVDLERFEKALIHEDYKYIIDILKGYTQKRESELFVSNCCLKLRNMKRSEYHLKNILRLTVQIGIFSILGKILFDIALDLLTNLVDEEAWGLALEFIQSLNIYNLPYNAKYFLLSAEIYLANNKAVKACNLLKYQNIICTNRDRWYVNSTVDDEHVRNKIICILLDSFCNEFLEYAFFLFQFLLKDQYSYYDPIDLSCYVDKLIVLSLSKNDTSLITEMSNLILKHNFALSTITCRALISTIIHTNEVLARQIYNYAENMGIYSTVKLLPIIHTIINTDLTEEEIYLIFLQLLKNLIMSYGHAIEFAKPHEIKVYFILEIKTNKQFYCAALQSHYNNKAIMNAKALIRNVLKKRFDPPILLMKSNKGRIGKLQSKSVINYLKSEHCN